MRLLLDTHAFLWWITDSEKLSQAASAAMADDENELLLSAASAWEIATKFALGKLPLPTFPREYIPLQMQLNRITPLVVTVSHALQVESLP